MLSVGPEDEKSLIRDIIDQVDLTLLGFLM